MVRFFFILLLQVNFLFAQKAALSKDERGKFIYYEALAVNGLSKKSLFDKANGFLKESKNTISKFSLTGDSAVKASGRFIINQTNAALSHPAGAIQFNFLVEIQEHRYRFWLTDYAFIPYKRNRYGNFVPETIFGTPLEKMKKKSGGKEENRYEEDVAVQSKTFGDNFKMSLSLPGVKESGKKVDTRKW